MPDRHDEHVARAVFEIRSEDPKNWSRASDETIAGTMRARWMVLSFALADIGRLIIDALPAWLGRRLK